MELQLSFSQLLSIWWLRTWRGALAGAAATVPFALGFYLLGRAGVASPWLKWAWQAVIVLIGAAIAYYVSRMSLTKRYSDFRLAFLPAHGDGPELPLTNFFVIRFWWFLVWRVTIGAAIIGLAVELVEKHLPAGILAAQVIGAVLLLAWEFFVLRQALTRRYPEFRIAIMAHAPP